MSQTPKGKRHTSTDKLARMVDGSRQQFDQIARMKAEKARA